MSPGKNLYFLNVILFWYSLKHLGSIFNTSMMQKKLVYFDILCKYTYAYPDTSIDSFNNKFYKYLMGMLLHTRQIVKGWRYSGEQNLYGIYLHGFTVYDICLNKNAIKGKN